MRTVIVPNFVHDKINEILDSTISEIPEAAKEREDLYQILLKYFDRNGFLPGTFKLERLKAEAARKEEENK